MLKTVRKIDLKQPSEQHQVSVSRQPSINALTGMRAVLILWIVLYHLQPELSALLPFAPLLNLAAAGFAGVDFFFIASGFIIAYNYATRLNPFNLKVYRRFLWLRLARIYPVHLFTLLWVVLLLCAAKMTGSALSNPAFYTFPSLIQNLFLIHAWTLPTTFSWNAVSWAVSNEWMAYLAFPLIIAVTLRIRSVLVVIVSIFLLLWGMTACCLWLDASWQAPYGAGSYGLLRAAGEFTAGCLLYNLHVAGWGNQWGGRWVQQRRKGLVTNVAWAVAIIGSVVIVAHGLRSNAVTDAKTFQLQVLWLTPLFAFAIYALSWQYGAIANLFKTKLLMMGGELSYSLYLTHFIVLIVLRRVFPFESMVGANVLMRLLLVFGYLAVMGVAAIATYRLVESPGRLWMKKMMPPSAYRQ